MHNLRLYTRHDFENLTKYNSSGLNGPYGHMRGQCRSMFVKFVKLLYFYSNKRFITLICALIYASKAVS
jgi:hypothetical protein